MSRHSAYDRITWRGVTLNRRTAKALEWAEKDSGVTISVSQGSYRPHTSYSGSTHMGGGAVDVRVAHLSEHSRKKLIRSLKRAGFAAWYRPACSAWGAHCHAIARNDKQASSAARWQVSEYDARRSGLTSGGHDGTWRPNHRRSFNWKAGHPVEAD